MIESIRPGGNALFRAVLADLAVGLALGPAMYEGTCIPATDAMRDDRGTPERECN